jgi:hypothetical protein
LLDKGVQIARSRVGGEPAGAGFPGEVLVKAQADDALLGQRLGDLLERVRGVVSWLPLRSVGPLPASSSAAARCWPVRWAGICNVPYVVVPSTSNDTSVVLAAT